MDIGIPDILKSIQNPPKAIYETGVDIEEILQRPRVAIVSSRKVSSYGKNITTMFATELAKTGNRNRKQPGVWR